MDLLLPRSRHCSGSLRECPSYSLIVGSGTAQSLRLFGAPWFSRFSGTTTCFLSSLFFLRGLQILSTWPTSSQSLQAELSCCRGLLVRSCLRNSSSIAERQETGRCPRSSDGVARLISRVSLGMKCFYSRQWNKNGDGAARLSMRVTRLRLQRQPSGFCGLGSGVSNARHIRLVIL